jgi:alpha-tubulin suppressor-like RCC1 family protein
MSMLSLIAITWPLLLHVAVLGACSESVSRGSNRQIKKYSDSEKAASSHVLEGDVNDVEDLGRDRSPKKADVVADEADGRDANEFSQDEAGGPADSLSPSPTPTAEVSGQEKDGKIVPLEKRTIAAADDALAQLVQRDGRGTVFTVGESPAIGREGVDCRLFGTINVKCSPVFAKVELGDDDIVQIGGGRNVGAILALTSKGEVWSWGRKPWHLGYDVAGWESITPKKIPGLSGIVHLEVGSSHVMAIAKDGTVWGWGYNVNGQLGIKAPETIITPVQIPFLKGVKKLALGQFFTVALLPTGEVVSFGSNFYGALGAGPRDASGRAINDTPRVITQLKNIRDVYAGFWSAAAVTKDDQVYVWGSNATQVLGDGTNIDRLEPVPIAALTGAIKLTIGASNGLALKRDGSVWSWGTCTSGCLGREGGPAPAQIPNLTNIVELVAPSSYYAHALDNAGNRFSWGRQQKANFGDANASNVDEVRISVPTKYNNPPNP